MARLLGAARSSTLEWHAPVMAEQALRRTLSRAFEVSETVMSGSDPESRILLEEVLLLALGRASEFAQASQPGRPDAANLVIVLERLADDVDHAPSLDELAALAGVTRYMLVRQFGRRHGLPPMAWRQQLQLQRARDRIAAGRTLADTALECGFSDQSHLTRLFTRQFGYTPGAWRKAIAPG